MEYTVTYQEDAVYQNGPKMDITDFGYEYSHNTEEEVARNYRVNLGEWWNGKETVICARIAGAGI